MKEIVQKYKNHICRKENVVGIGVGEKWSHGKNTGRPAILVFVKEKTPKYKLKKHDLIEKNLDGVITDVVGKTGIIETQGYTRRERPIRGGLSCGHMQVTAGTMGGFFVDRDGDIVGLSNNHVLANENKAYVIGERKPNGLIATGNISLQPGRYDGGKRRDKFGYLKKFVRLTKNNNLQDSAITKVINKKKAWPNIKGRGPMKGFDEAYMGQRVQKVGRTTSRTTGNIIAIHTSVRVNFDIDVLEFDDCIMTGAMSSGGDSGSLLLSMNMKVLGLLFAGSSNVTVYNPIKYPVETYGLRIWTP